MSKTILIVDDDPPILESLCLALTDEGYQVQVAEGNQAMQQCLNERIPDVVVLDYWLPGDHGGLITAHLKTSPETKDVPVMIISASHNIAELVEKAGADDYVQKPYDLDFFLSHIAGLLNGLTAQ